MKQKMSYEQHVQLGLELAAMNERLNRLQVELCTATSKSSRAMQSLRQMHKHLTTLRSELENTACRDYPEQFELSVYFGVKP